MSPLKKLLKFCNGNFPRGLRNPKKLSSLNIKCSYCSNAFNEKFQLNEDDNFYSKIIYNEILSKTPVKKADAFKPIFLKYLDEKKNITKAQKDEAEPEIVNFPFKIKEEVLSEIKLNDKAAEGDVASSDKAQFEEGEWKISKVKVDTSHLEDPKRWNIISLLDDKLDDEIKYGTCDPNVPVSRIPCGGCGAYLHCNDPSIPGFITKEVFQSYNKEELRGEICQRCHFLRTFNVALGMSVSLPQYEQIISTLRDKEGLVIFMVDLLDFPCSIYPKVFDLIGPTKPVVVVGNKVDLLMQENSSFLDNFKESLLSSLKEKKFNLKTIKHVALISAKTGYGVEELITTLQNCWGNQGDVYLLGCTNVGKSSLFNTFIQSDYCNVSASDILQRATVSEWPGTTLNLLKFPISKIKKWRLVARQNRLVKEEYHKLTLQRLQFLDQTIRFQQIPLADSVGRTFEADEKNKNSQESDRPLEEAKEERRIGIGPKNPSFHFSKWFYDTPGVVHHDQILNLLTTSELLLTIPTKILIPRNFRMTPGHSVFIGGLARLDYISGPNFVWFTVFASENLPVTVTRVEDAAEVYQKLLGTPLFRVPTEGKSRLSKWPDLASKKIEITGTVPRKVSEDRNYRSESAREADADVVLSSAGWVAVSVLPPYRGILEAWTPEGRGIHVRKVPIVRKGHTFRGERIGNGPAFKTVVTQGRAYTIMDDPPF